MEGASEATLARSLTKNVHLCTHLLTVCLETLLLREENQRIPLTTGTYVLKHHLNFQKNQSRPCQVLSTFCQRRFRNLRKFTKIYENLRKFTKIYEKNKDENACDFKIKMFWWKETTRSCLYMMKRYGKVRFGWISSQYRFS